MKATQYNDTHVQALAYAEADRSDPFPGSCRTSPMASAMTKTAARMPAIRRSE